MIERRDENETGWLAAFRQHGVSMAIGLFWMGGLFWLNSLLAWWVLPVAVPMVLSAPLWVYSSRAVGRALRRHQLLVVPDKITPTEVLQRLDNARQAWRRRQREQDGFVRAVTDPYANQVHIAPLRGRSCRSSKARERNRKLRKKAIAEGPGGLSASERSLLLQDAESMAALHLKLCAGLAMRSWQNHWGLCERLTGGRRSCI